MSITVIFLTDFFNLIEKIDLKNVTSSKDSTNFEVKLSNEWDVSKFHFKVSLKSLL